ncbi:MAG TPA: carbon storage regulator [Polyangiaceae bacterium]|nr:carbon storage regulator [Polyangiaceae bacterium]
MLVVARRKGQRVVIGSDIEIVVTELSRTTVKLGIVAPASCTILRGEIHEAVVEANRSAVLAALEASATAEEAEPEASSESVPRDGAGR